MKIIFAGSPEYAVPSLRALHEKFGVCAVVTQPDRPVGRKKVLTPTPVKSYALENGIPVIDSPRIRDCVEELKSFGADIMVTCAYGQILTKQVLSAFPLGVWNLHASLLPEFRGASPIQSAILAGKEYTGVTVMKTEEALDSGDILLIKRCAVADKTCGQLSEELSLLSAEAAEEAVSLIQRGEVQLLLQDDSSATYCKKIKKEDARINFESGKSAVRLIKAMSPQPLAYCFLNGVQLNIYDAQPVTAEGGKVGEVVSADKLGIVVKCADGAINIIKAQFAGGKPLSAADLANGRKIKAGDILD